MFRVMFWLAGRSKSSFWAIPHQSPTYILMFWGQNHFCPPQIQLESRRTGTVLTRRMATYKEVVLTKVASNHTRWWSNHSKWLSRLPCPPQIQLESRRTGAVLTRRMATYEEVFLTKVASNHTSWWSNHSKWLSRLPCPPQIQLESRREGTVWPGEWPLIKKVRICGGQGSLDNHFEWLDHQLVWFEATFVKITLL